MSAPTGRARGRARGRGRATASTPAPTPGEQAARPPPAQAEAPVAPGRGRTRGAATQPMVAAALARPPAQPEPVEPPIQQMAAMRVGPEGAGGLQGRQARRPRYEALRTRPEHIIDKQGKTGSVCNLLSNNFRLRTAREEWALYQYHVDFNPPLDSKRLRIALVKSQKDIIGATNAFDGMVLYLPIKLERPETQVMVQTQKGENVQITFKLTNELPPYSNTCMHMYNVIFRKVMSSLNMQQIGRHYFNPDSKIMVKQHRLEIWPGFITSISQRESVVMLEAEVSHKVLCLNSVLDVLYELYNKDSRRFRDEAMKKLVGEIVLTRYNNKTYRVDDINFDLNPSSKFKKFDGSEISYCEYYSSVYERNITDMQQPLLVSRPKKREMRAGKAGPEVLHLIPEFCTMTGLSEEVRSNFSVMKDLAQHTRVDPKNRATTLNRFMTDISNNPEARGHLEKWGLSLDNNMLNLQGRCLGSEQLYQKNFRFSYENRSADWTRETRGKPVQSTVNLTNWMVVFSPRDKANAQDFIQTLIRVCGPIGMQVAQPIFIALQNDRTDSYIQAIKEKMTQQIQMVLCIVPNNRKDRYDAIKKLCCLEFPVPSQVVVGRTISKKQMLMSVSTKIGMQLNCKLGGELWCTDIPVCIYQPQSALINHSTFKKLLFFCWLGSYNSYMLSLKALGDADCFLPFCVASLRNYHNINQAFPSRIVVYRDGVGEGQTPTLIEHELPQMLKCIQQLITGPEPALTMVIVRKRISTRLILNSNGQLSNPLPGTIADSVITKPEKYDFYLVSQSVRQGTVSPTNYDVVWDKANLKPDHLQRLTYKLTHLYYNWPGTIRVPAPCQYAHKLAFLVGQSLHKDPRRELADRLFFL
ncbi:piwi-like protein 1 [Anneissia japonica]|uniref:piwi-like protein 1 n=1 Tax=Anneissia japonica TaxID=1529436 RepID=UPI00142584BA|nr:piwi-like protein 1 [Anneissia japonica]